jgi:hypothetical protein
MEAEYSALLTTMHYMLLIKIVATNILNSVGLADEPITHFKTTVWEDNVMALKLATMERGRMTP